MNQAYPGADFQMVKQTLESLVEIAGEIEAGLFRADGGSTTAGREGHADAVQTELFGKPETVHRTGCAGQGDKDMLLSHFS